MNDVVDASQETAVNGQYLCLQQSENLIKSIQKKLLQFKQSSENLYSCQKSLHEDLIALQDKYLEKEIKVEINAFFDGFSQALLCIQQSLGSVPQKINDFIQNIDGITKNQWKKRQFLKEKYEHYLNKVQDLVLKQEEQAAKQNPNSFILSAGTGVGTISLQQRKNNPKVTRNNDKLKNSAIKYQDINNRVAQELSNLFKMRNGIISTLGKQLADSLIENFTPMQATIDSIKKKSDSVAISQNSNRSNNGAAGGNTSNCNVKIKFSSVNSIEQEQLEKEITIRGIFKIPATMDLPVIRRRSIKITQDGQVVNDHGGNNKKEYNPVPFESSNPNIIIYLSRLVQQDKNIFDFEDFNNKDANQNEENSDNSNNNQIQDHSGLEGSIERVYTNESHSNEFEENSEDVEEEDSPNIVICNDSDDSKSNENYQDQDDQNNNAYKQQNKIKNTSVSKDPKINQKAKSQKKKSIKKQQQQILSDSIFRYEQERKKQLINQILIKEGGAITTTTTVNQSINGNQNPQNSFNNFYQNQQPSNYQPQNKQQISPQSSLPEKSNKSNLSQGSANRNNQFTINSVQDQLVQQRNYQHKQNINNLNPNQFHSASYQVPSSNSIKTPNFNNNQLQQQQQPVNFNNQNLNNNNFCNQTSTNTTSNNLSISKQNNICIQIQQQSQSRTNQSSSNLPSPKQFNNINNNTVNQQVSTPQNVNSNNHQAGFNQSRNQQSQQLYLSPNPQNSQQSFSNYLSPQKERKMFQNNVYQQGNSNLNQTNQSQLNYQQPSHENQFVQQISRNSLPNTFNNNYGIQNSNTQNPVQTIQKKPSQNSLSDMNQIQRMSLQSSQQQQQNFQKMQSQNYFNGYVNMQQNTQANQPSQRKNSDNRFNQGDSQTKNAQNQQLNFNINESQPQQNNQINNIINQQQQQQKSSDYIIAFNNQSEKLVNNQISNGFQQQKQQQNYQNQNGNQINGQMYNSNIISNSQMMQQQQVNGINKINKVNSLQLEEKKAQNLAYQGSSTATNQQQNQIRNFYQQQTNPQQSTFKNFVNRENGNEKMNFKQNSQIEGSQKQNEDNESDDNSILSLTLIDD
ncbi:hypothetical protein ABPG72_015688 [Tetrahymena utriculariae]